VIFDAREMAQLRHLQILASKVVKGQLHGEREMAHRGPGSGFREHRQYHEGDSLRRVDWNVYARTDDLVVKEFDAEEALDTVILQDGSASMAGAAARCAAKVAGALGAVTLTQLDRLIWVPAGGPRHLGDVYLGRARLLELLDSVDFEPAGTTDLLAAARANIPRSGRGGVAFVVSDFFDPNGATRALSFLLSRRYQVRAVLVEDMAALAPPKRGRTRLFDAETGRTLKLDITPEVIDAYIRAREARIQGLLHFCKRTGAGFMRVRADQPFFEIVQTAIARGWLTP
jgi:uncharacterized protein (DUF58 family)